MIPWLFCIEVSYIVLISRQTSTTLVNMKAD